VVGVVVAADSFRSEMMPSEVDQLPPDVQGSQVEKVPGRLHLDLGEGVVKPKHAVLENVSGFFPPPQIPGTVKNLPGEPPETVAGVVEQCLH
jgi:hypothetical protein